MALTRTMGHLTWLQKALGWGWQVPLSAPQPCGTSSTSPAKVPGLASSHRPEPAPYLRQHRGEAQGRALLQGSLVLFPPDASPGTDVQEAGQGPQLGGRENTPLPPTHIHT